MSAEVHRPADGVTSSRETHALWRKSWVTGCTGHVHLGQLDAMPLGDKCWLQGVGPCPSSTPGRTSWLLGAWMEALWDPQILKTHKY